MNSVIQCFYDIDSTYDRHMLSSGLASLSRCPAPGKRLWISCLRTAAGRGAQPGCWLLSGGGGHGDYPNETYMPYKLQDFFAWWQFSLSGLS